MSTESPPSHKASAPPILDKAYKPPGVLPRNAQAWTLVGVATLMIAVLALSGGGSDRTGERPDFGRSAPADPNEARIQEYRNRIEEHARKLRAEQERLREARQALPGAEPPVPEAPLPPSASTSGGHGYAPTAPREEKSAIERDRERRAYESLFASNVALSYRPPSGDASGHAVPNEAYLASAGEGGIEASPEQTASQSEPTSGRAAAAEVGPSAERGAGGPSIDAELSEAEGNRYRLFEGQWIEAVLTNRLDASFSGPVNCMVTTNVYSHDRQRLLIPQGARILGRVERVDHFGQQRVAVFFHRIIMPDGFSVSLEQFPGINQVGETGLRDKVNHHYLKIFGGSIALGALAGFSLQNTNLGFAQSGTDAYRAGLAQRLSQTSQRILDRFLNILPTVTIREGHRVKVYLTADLLLPDYARHSVPSDL